MKSFYYKVYVIALFLSCSSGMDQHNIFRKVYFNKALLSTVYSLNSYRTSSSLFATKVPIFSSLISKDFASYPLKFSFSTDKSMPYDSDDHFSDRPTNISYPQFVRVVLQNNKNELLVLRTPYSGKYFWIFPGGWIKKNETAEEAAKRQVLEETGLSFGYSENLGEFITPKPYKGKHYKGCVFLVKLDNFDEAVNREPHVASDISVKTYQDLLKVSKEEDSYVTEVILEDFIARYDKG